MLERYYNWYGKKVVWSVLGLLAILSVTAIYFTLRNDSIGEESDLPKLNAVELKAVSDLNFSKEFASVGVVQAVSEANLQTEAGGRVTAVNTELGKTVTAGTIIASIENNSERAALLQAEGSYESAVAAAAQSDVGVNEARIALTAAYNNAISTNRNAVLSVQNIVTNSVDRLFSNPAGAVPGVKIGGTSNTAFLNEARVELQTVLPDWSSTANSLTATGDIEGALDESRINLQKLISLVDTIILVLNADNLSSTFTPAEIDAFKVEFATVRVELNNTLNAINNADTSISSAKETVEKIQLAGTSGEVSSANAQVKIALGALRAAQANLEKTLVRSPITGVVNALYLKAGDYVSMGQPAAIVANNNGLEILTSVSEADRDKLSIGQTVRIDANATGVITAIAGAVDPTSGKVAVKVSVSEDSELKNGSTVSLRFTETSAGNDTDIVIPLAAVKMTGTGPVAFTVSNDSTLEAIELTLGTISGDSVVVSEGLSPDTMIVTDARGLKAGETVTIKK